MRLSGSCLSGADGVAAVRLDWTRLAGLDVGLGRVDVSRALPLLGVPASISSSSSLPEYIDTIKDKHWPSLPSPPLRRNMQHTNTSTRAQNTKSPLAMQYSYRRPTLLPPPQTPFLIYLWARKQPQCLSTPVHILKPLEQTQHVHNHPLPTNASRIMGIVKGRNPNPPDAVCRTTIKLSRRI